MIPAGPVHFIYLGGPFPWQSRRAVVTAQDVHGAPVILWVAASASPPDDLPPGVEIRPLFLPRWMADHPIHLANVKDLFAWQILGTHGGLYLDLDTISLRPVWDLLTFDVLVSSEWEPGWEAGPRYNSAVVAARKGAPILDLLCRRALKLLLTGETRWGACGPWLLTDVVPEYPGAFDVAPMPLLNGWRDDTIHLYYEGARPGPDVRVVHLYQSSRPDAYLADRWMP